MPSRLPSTHAQLQQGPLPRAVCRRRHQYYGPLGLPSGSARFRLLALYARSSPDPAADEGLPCSASPFRCVLLPIPRTDPTRWLQHSRAVCCLRRDMRGSTPIEHLSADNLTRRQDSLHVAGRSFASSMHRGFRRPARQTTSRSPAGACYRARWRLPGRDSHPRGRCSLSPRHHRPRLRHDAPCPAL